MADIVRSRIDPALELKRGGTSHATRKHAHEGPSISLVVAGSTTLYIGRDHHVLGPGDYVYIPAGIVHLCSPERAREFRYATLNVPTNWMSNVEGRGLVARIGHAPPKMLVAALCEIVESRSLAEGITGLGKLIDSLAASGESPARRFGVTPIPLDSGSSEGSPEGRTGYSSRYQRYRVLTRTYGVGGRSIAQISRVERAKKLLREGHGIVDAALDCGYFDQSHFTRAFRLYTGLTPAQFIGAR